MVFELLLVAVAVMAGSVAAVAGFGIGSLLTPALAPLLGTPLAVAAVTLPHAAGTALYAAQWLCALVVLWRTTTPVRPASS